MVSNSGVALVGEPDGKAVAVRAAPDMAPKTSSRKRAIAISSLRCSAAVEAVLLHTAGTRRRAGRDHHAGIDIDLQEAFAGTTRTLELKRPQVKSDGTLEVEPHTVRVTIPAGVTEGQPIRLAGQGEPGPGGGHAGDLYLEVHIRPDKLFQLEGRDVTLTLPVAPWEAALGGPVKVPTLAGAVEMNIPAGAQSGQKLRLRGRGLPGQQPGDQYVQLKVVLPPANSPEAKAVYEEMRRTLAFDPRVDLER